MTTKLKLYNYWNQLYPDLPADKLDVFISNINVSDKKEVSKDWFKDAIVYSLYVNLYNEDFYGLTEKLDYIKNLGINCLWLLPILQSPMRDAGFDISKYDRIRPSLLGLSDESTRGDQEVVFNK